LRGNATIVAPGRVRVDDTEHEAATIVIATGSADKLPKLDGLAEGRPFWTSRDATAGRVSYATASTCA
jgi:pyruvate/2-oxoglutarate dehydrogenase complex dihydrolipoamide dehydrogenase (E3) component